VAKSSGGNQLESYITEFYKGLFGPSKGEHFSLDESRYQDIPQVSTEENEALTAVFSEKEVIFHMKHNKASCPDGFHAEFYQAFWEVLKGDLMDLFKHFHEGKLPLYNLNFGIITLLPKQKEAAQIRQFCPICLVNVSFIFKKN
jgi:hypothetical protein